MSQTTILFIQGGAEGAYSEDMPFVADLQSALRAEVIAYPAMPGLERLDWPEARQNILAALEELLPGTSVIAHSLGASGVLKVLSEEGRSFGINGLFLLATPYVLSDGEWGDQPFSFDADFADRLPDVGPITLYHSRDDQFIPFSHLGLWGARTHGAKLVAVDGHGHFGSHQVPELIADVRAHRQ